VGEEKKQRHKISPLWLLIYMWLLLRLKTYSYSDSMEICMA